MVLLGFGPLRAGLSRSHLGAPENHLSRSVSANTTEGLPLGEVLLDFVRVFLETSTGQVWAGGRD